MSNPFPHSRPDLNAPPPASAARPAPTPRPLGLWEVLLAPFFSRGRFSPRLLMAWCTLLFCFRIIDNWQNSHPFLLKDTIIQPKDIMALVGVLVALVTALLGMGTYQKVKLGDTAPASGENETENHA